MSIEIEKKYRLTNKQHESVRRRLPEIGAELQREEFEENTLYGGKGLSVGRSVLRLRRVGDSAILAYNAFPLLLQSNINAKMRRRLTILRLLIPFW